MEISSINDKIMLRDLISKQIKFGDHNSINYQVMTDKKDIWEIILI